MQTLQHPYSVKNLTAERNTTMPVRFFNWCKSQEKYRIGWLAVTIAIHGCILTPMTLVSIIFSGNNIVFWMLAMVAMTMSIVTNLAALPTKITIPIFFFSVLIDLVVIINCLLIGFNISATYL